jgi:hypothetical protein
MFEVSVSFRPLAASRVQTPAGGVVDEIVYPTSDGHRLQFLTRESVENYDHTAAFGVTAAYEETMVGFVQGHRYVLLPFEVPVVGEPLRNIPSVSRISVPWRLKCVSLKKR